MKGMDACSGVVEGRLKHVFACTELIAFACTELVLGNNCSYTLCYEHTAMQSWSRIAAVPVRSYSMPYASSSTIKLSYRVGTVAM